MQVRYFPIGGSGANCYLVKNLGAAVVIDPFDADNRVTAFLGENKGLERYILLTHFHYDHILGADKLRQLYGAKIVIGIKDAPGLRDPALSLAKYVGLEQQPFYADIIVEGGQRLKLGDDEFEVIHTPGHTAGSVCYKVDNVIFTGDTLFKDSVGRTDFPTGSYSDLMESLWKLRMLDGQEDIILYPGHGPETTLKTEIAQNPYM